MVVLSGAAARGGSFGRKHGLGMGLSGGEDGKGGKEDFFISFFFREWWFGEWIFLVGGRDEGFGMGMGMGMLVRLYCTVPCRGRCGRGRCSRGMVVAWSSWSEGICGNISGALVGWWFVVGRNCLPVSSGQSVTSN